MLSKPARTSGVNQAVSPSRIPSAPPISMSLAAKLSSKERRKSGRFLFAHHRRQKVRAPSHARRTIAPGLWRSDSSTPPRSPPRRWRAHWSLHSAHLRVPKAWRRGNPACRLFCRWSLGLGLGVGLPVLLLGFFRTCQRGAQFEQVFERVVPERRAEAQEQPGQNDSPQRR